MLQQRDTILISGCGSCIFLQNDLAKTFLNARFFCTDFAKVIELVKAQVNARNEGLS